MSVSIRVVAQRKVSEADFARVRIFNDLVRTGYEVPQELETDLRKRLGDLDELDEGELISISGSTVEIPLEGKGAVMYNEGMVINVADFPPDTVSIRICAYA